MFGGETFFACDLFPISLEVKQSLEEKILSCCSESMKVAKEIEEQKYSEK